MVKDMKLNLVIYYLVGISKYIGLDKCSYDIIQKYLKCPQILYAY